MPLTNSGPIRPILRWAGGKYGIVPHLIRLVPKTWTRYVEPMVGGGALFFSLRPAEALLADGNADLINFYQVLRAYPDDLLKSIAELSASRELYYQMRSSQPTDLLCRATRFMYLNRLCWNGLHRVNRHGVFNVPMGDRFPAKLWDVDRLCRASAALRDAQLHHADFSVTLSMLQPGDFVFLDPPYPRGSDDALGFNRYSSDLFSYEDHACLSQCIGELNTNGIKTMIVLRDIPALNELYPHNMWRHRISSKALISCDGASRRRVDELILTSYRTGHSPRIRESTM